MAVPAIPLHLLLLVHLHLLRCPHVDKSEYNADIFNPQLRGIRDRSKTMEEISYFLVGKVERSSQAAKRLLPTYPCLQPVDSTSFRTALTKYLEMLRNRVVRPDIPLVSTSSSTAKDYGIADAWWWMDVVVRKSIIEECSGERFERLLIALSTHAILNNSRLRPDDIFLVDEKAGLVNLQELPSRYASLVAHCLSHRLLWEHAAASLLQKQQDLDALRSLLRDTNNSRLSRCASISTDRLIALCASRKEDLLRDGWKDAEGHKALYFLLGLANLKDIEAKLQDSPSTNRESIDVDFAVSRQSQPAPIQPLFTAAAHHLSHLKNLTEPLLPRTPSSADADQMKRPTDTSSPSVNILLRERLNSVARSRSTLEEALRRMQFKGESLNARLEKVQTKVRAQIQPDVVLELPAVSNAGLNLDFDARPSSTNGDRAAPKGLQTVEEHMHHIRDTELPQYPSIEAKEITFRMPFNPAQAPAPASGLCQPSTNATSTKSYTASL